MIYHSKYQACIDSLKYDGINSVDELLDLIFAIGHDYDGYSKPTDLKDIIDEMVAYSMYARELLHEGKYFQEST